MMARRARIITMLLLSAKIFGCTETSNAPIGSILPPVTSTYSAGIKMKNKIPIIDPNDQLEVDRMPKISKMSNEQRSYVVEILAATTRVIDGISTLETEEKDVFGEGQYFWPKNPDEPIKLSKSFMTENFRMKGIALRFERNAEGARWTKAELTVHPINFPIGIYEMNLPKETFLPYRVHQSELKISPHETLKRINVFHYVKKNDDRSIMSVEAKEDVSSLSDTYPSSFHAIRFEHLK